MTKHHKLVIVSNRLPVSVERAEDGTLLFHPSSGGLATAMSSLELEDTIWVGWPGLPSDDLTDAEREEITERLAELGCFPVYLTEQEVHLFYEGYSNDTLWPLFHYFQEYARYSDAYWEAYQEVNRRYAEAVKAASPAQPLVWIHDYHLMLLPMYLREILPSAGIGFFLHIPFPSFEIFRSLPQRKELLEGLLGADLIGFHIYDYARHFLSSCLRLLGIPSRRGCLEYKGRMIQTEAFPIGVDYAKLRSTAQMLETKRASRAIKDAHKGQKIVLSIDRLDYSKGIPQRLEAFQALLETYPEYRGKIKLVMISVPSRVEVETYKQLRDQVEQTVSRINGEYGTVDWAPISYQFQNRPFDEIVTLYAAADIALVTPVRDGMNLVAKEYVAAQGADAGVLILSEMTGAADELPEAILINPNDSHSITEGIRSALRLSKRERWRRMKVMQQRLQAYDVGRWGRDFLGTLQAVGDHHSQQNKLLSPEGTDQLKADYSHAASRLILLDYDGTLKNFVPTPSPRAARPSVKLLWVLRRLSKQPGTHVAVVSGRPKKVLEQWFKDIPVDLAAEHGAWTRIQGVWEAVADTNFDAVKRTIRPVFEWYHSRTAGAVIEEKEYAMVWHYRNVSPELAYVRAQELQRELIDLVDDDSVGVFSGSKIIEIKPNTVTKGRVARKLIRMYHPDLTIAAGDDYTDEDMFHELSDSGYGIKVGLGETKAKHQVATVEEMVELLDTLSRS